MANKSGSSKIKGKGAKKATFKLKAVLATYQSRSRKTKKESETMKAKKMNGTKITKPDVLASARACLDSSKETRSKYTIPFEHDDHILLVGEGGLAIQCFKDSFCSRLLTLRTPTAGNFSFTFSLVTLILPNSPRHQFTATSYDSELECYRKYAASTTERVAALRTMGIKIIFNVDAKNIESCKEIRSMKKTAGKRWNGWNKVVFNFPHAGAGIKDQDRNILINQRLLLGFFASIAPFLSKGHTSNEPLAKKQCTASDEEADNSSVEGTLLDIPPNAITTLTSQLGPESAPLREGAVLITLRDSIPYTLWDVPGLAKRPPVESSKTTSGHTQFRYRQVRSFAFHPDAYPGYEHCRTIGFTNGSNDDILRGPCRTWEFVLKAGDENL